MSMRRILSLSVLFVVLAVVSITFSWSGADRPRGEPHVTVAGTRFSVEIADTEEERARGLSGWPSLGEGEGMLFLFPSEGIYGFWMKEMKFPIDIIWIKGDRVVGFSESAEPEPGLALNELPIYYPSEPADKVLEINAGLVKKYGFEVGDRIVIQ